MYNVKILDYANELQLNWYKFTIGTKEKKESVKNASSDGSIKACKQSDISSKQCSSSDNEIDNKIRSTRRTIQSIYNISRANKWDYFCTFTYSKDRYDYDMCKKRLQTFLNNLKKRKCVCMEYLAVPELHKDGAYHFHALIKGISEDIICDSYERGKKMFVGWSYGISQCEVVEDTNRVAMYITKYITKDLVDDVKGRQRYLCSNGCKRAEEKTFLVENMNVVEFLENNFPEYEIFHSKDGTKKGRECSFIQLRPKRFNEELTRKCPENTGMCGSARGTM